MLVLGTFLAIGLLLGWGLGGGVRNLAGVQIRLWWAIPLALGIQALPAMPWVEPPLPVILVLASLAVLMVVVAVNRRLFGFLVVLTGLALNFAVIAANQGMPVSREAALLAGGADRLEEIPVERGSRHHLAGPDAMLMPLADVIPIRPPFRVVVSMGDLLTYGGVAAFVTAAMLGRPDRRPSRPERREHAPPPPG